MLPPAEGLRVELMPLETPQVLHAGSGPATLWLEVNGETPIIDVRSVTLDGVAVSFAAVDTIPGTVSEVLVHAFELEYFQIDGAARLAVDLERLGDSDGQ